MKGHKQNNNKVPKAPYVTKALRAHINRPEELKAEILAEALEGKLTNAELAEKYRVPVTTVNGYLSGVMGVEDRREQFAGHAKALDNTEEQIAALKRGESLIPAPAPAPAPSIFNELPFRVTYMEKYRRLIPLQEALNALLEEGATTANVAARFNVPATAMKWVVSDWRSNPNSIGVREWESKRNVVIGQCRSKNAREMNRSGVQFLQTGYTRDEVRRMLQLRKEGHTYAAIALDLGRTTKSVMNKFSRLKLGVARGSIRVMNQLPSPPPLPILAAPQQQVLQFCNPPILHPTQAQAPAPPAPPAPVTPAPAQPSLLPLSMLEELEAQKAQLAAKNAADMAELDAKIEAGKQAMAREQLRPTIIDRLTTYINVAKDGDYCVIDGVCAVEMLKKADRVWDKRKDRTSTAIWITADKPVVGEYTEADLQLRYNAGHMDGKEAAAAEMVTIVEADKRVAEAREKAHPLYGMNPHIRQIFEAQVQAFVNTHVKASTGAQADVLRFMLLSEVEEGRCHNHHSMSTCFTNKKDSLGFFSGYKGEAINHAVKHLVKEGWAKYMPPDPVSAAAAGLTDQQDWPVELTDKGRGKAEFFLAHPILMRALDTKIQKWLDKQPRKRGGGK